MELTFTFNNQGAGSFFYNAWQDMAAYQAAADTMSDAWIAFIRTGDPSTAALGEWPQYDTTSRQTMQFDLTSSLVSDPVSRERTIWGDLAFDGVSPAREDLDPTKHPDSDFSGWAVMNANLGGMAALLLVMILLVTLACCGCC